jgi:hypothetical protein
MSSTKLWLESNTSNKITNHGEGRVETEYGIRNNYSIMHVSDKVWWVMALSYAQELEKDVKIYGSPRFIRVRIVMISTQGRIFCIYGYVHRAVKLCHHLYHITDAIIADNISK